jgi:hypothetical protein
MGISTVVAGCSAGVTPTAKAASVAQSQCDRRAGTDVRVLQATAVLSARPLYSHVITGKNDSEERVTGARLLVHAPGEVTAEQFARIVRCHSAQVLLGQVDFAEDPYTLPGAWIDVDVKPEGNHLDVLLRAENVPEGLKVLHRATAFAESHAVPALP